MNRRLAFLFVATISVACSTGDSTGPAPSPPPPPELVATGDWVGDWRLLEDSSTGESNLIRFTTVLTDGGGILSGTCKFEVLDLLPAFLACDRAAGARSGDHLSASVTLTFDFSSSSSGSVFNFAGTLQPGVITGTLHVIYPGYEFRPRSATRSSSAPRPRASVSTVEAAPGSAEHQHLSSLLRLAAGHMRRR